MTVIGASLSEPHTRELGGEISVRMYVCLLASSPGLFSRACAYTIFHKKKAWGRG